ncbi:hypothetical protein MPK66_gp313 [Erwinia phage pEa_SNUABM_2]|uniref:Uncharacterized protein n=1 Tax=Erwinia phage pEa_SNUABM_2 TaxID=2869547 RepID=A0AAE7XNR1_9CAUD|nr:hypothetical protein MPK66_gp313 [Erwinia phage pEa_SNUABM_2]QZE59557.1 hypothetical protein pEaSNUABM2_00313 [Erwinia phage pEa_SNUABM_2]QZE59894.1 hypothetical protein pEaSNUABM39_00314 [Erwinia phage pEa_SNUABM_39]
MKPDYTLLKRSKTNEDVFAFVFDGDVLAKFNASNLYRAFVETLKTNCINEVDILWRDGTRTVEQLVIHHTKEFASFDTIVHDYLVCLMLRAQGVGHSLAVPVDIRSMYDADGPMINEIRIDSEIVADMMRHIKDAPVDVIDDEDDEDDDMDEDDECWDEDQTEFHDIETESIADNKLQIGDWGYRAHDWAITLTDEQVDRIHFLEVGIDPDIELPLADDAKKDAFF